MPYVFDWMDEKRRILNIKPVDPLSADELGELFSRFGEILSQPNPVRALVNLREFAWKDFPHFDDNSFAFPEPLHSDVALALVGSGVFFRLLGGLMNNFVTRHSDAETVHFRVFEHEDQAYAWLSALADAPPG